MDHFFTLSKYSQVLPQPSPQLEISFYYHILLLIMSSAEIETFKNFQNSLLKNLVNVTYA